MTVIHGFQFFNELELLPLKLEELWDVVDVFILVEADLTFSGMSKGWYYERNKHMFEKYHSKIVHKKITMPHGPDPWVRERYQREVILGFAQKIDPNGVLLWSDMDEIVSRQSVVNWLNGATGYVATALVQKLYYYYFNNLAIDVRWAGGKIAKIAYIPDIPDVLSTMRYDPKLPEIEHGGWHFSFLGGKRRIQQKVFSYAHNELFRFVQTDEQVEELLATGIDFFRDRNIQFQFVAIDETYPQFLRDNFDHFSELGMVKQ